MFRGLSIVVQCRGFAWSAIQNWQCFSSDTNARRTEAQRRATIYAVSSGYGKCGVAVVRISGPAASTALYKMTRTTRLQPRKALLRTIRDPDSGEVLDKGLCLWFPGPNSFSGEDCVEFHVHGGPAILSAVLSSLSRLEFRLATAGEFTKRAFFNGKLDLTEAEAIGDLIDAETEQQRRQAVRQSSGTLRTLYDSWRKELLSSLAGLEASIDFEEEDNLGSVLPSVRKSLARLLQELNSHLEDGRRGEILRSGAKLVIVGEPNAGKSSLLNLLSGRQAAIVTAIPGTTRDAIEMLIDVHGYPVLLTDTAGIRDHPGDEIESEGIRRTLNLARDADLLVVMADARDVSSNKLSYVSQDTVHDVTRNISNRVKDIHDITMNDANEVTNNSRGDVVKDVGVVTPHRVKDEINDASQKFLERLRALGLAQSRGATLLVANKIDLLLEEQFKVPGFVGVSCKTGEGIENLLRELGRHCESICGNAFKEQPVITRARHREHLTRCASHIEMFLTRTDSGIFDVALSSEEVRTAARELGKITGLISTEEVLDIVFRNFCIGK